MHFWKIKHTLIDLPNFVVLPWLFHSFCSTAFYIPFFFLPEKGRISGLMEHEALFLISIIGITSMVGRIVCGWLADRPWTSPFYLYCGTIVMSGVAMLFSPFCNSQTTLSLMAAVFGINIGELIFLFLVYRSEEFGIWQAKNNNANPFDNCFLTFTATGLPPDTPHVGPLDLVTFKEATLFTRLRVH